MCRCVCLFYIIFIVQIQCLLLSFLLCNVRLLYTPHYRIFILCMCLCMCLSLSHSISLFVWRKNVREKIYKCFNNNYYNNNTYFIRKDTNAFRYFVIVVVFRFSSTFHRVCLILIFCHVVRCLFHLHAYVADDDNGDMFIAVVVHLPLLWWF